MATDNPHKAPPTEDFLEDKRPAVPKNLEEYDISDPADDEMPSSSVTGNADDDELEYRRKDGAPAVEDDGREELVERAISLGIDADELEDFSVSQIERMIRLVESRESGKNDRRPADRAEADEPATAGDSDETLGFNLEDVVDTEVAKAVQGLASRLRRLEGELKGYGEAARVSKFDDLMLDAAGNYPTLLGKGPTSSLDRRTSEFRNRKAVLDEMAAIEAGYDRMGRARPSDDALFKKALRSVFGDRIDSLDRRRTERKTAGRQDMFLSRATRKPGSGKGDSRDGIEAVRAFMLDRGML